MAAGRRLSAGRSGNRPNAMTRMDLARGLAVNRIVFGSGLVLAPGVTGRTWLGRDAHRPATKVFARALGARDVALGLGALLALQGGEPARRWFQGQLISDATDVIATLAAGRGIPPVSRAFALAVAGGSTAVAAACAMSPVESSGDQENG